MIPSSNMKVNYNIYLIEYRRLYGGWNGLTLKYNYILMCIVAG